jgi:hypothetical protein
VIPRKLFYLTKLQGVGGKMDVVYFLTFLSSSAVIFIHAKKSRIGLNLDKPVTMVAEIMGPLGCLGTWKNARACQGEGLVVLLGG